MPAIDYNLGKGIFTPKGAYNASTPYEPLDILESQGSGFVVLKNVTGVTPTNDMVNYMQIVSKGDTGARGPGFITGVYDTAAALNAAIPAGNSNYYAVKGDNKWYHYSASNGAFVPGGVLTDNVLYQAVNAQLANVVTQQNNIIGALTDNEGTAAAAELAAAHTPSAPTVGVRFDRLDSFFDSWNLLDGLSYVDNTILNIDGTTGVNAEFYTYEPSLTVGKRYYCSSERLSMARTVAFYNASAALISADDFVTDFVVPTGTVTTKVCYRKTVEGYLGSPCLTIYGDVADRKHSMNQKIPAETVLNAVGDELDNLNIADIVLSPYVSNGFYAPNGTLSTSSGYRKTEAIALAAGKTIKADIYATSSVSALTAVDASGAYLFTLKAGVGVGVVRYEYTAIEDMYVSVSYSYTSGATIKKSSDAGLAAKTVAKSEIKASNRYRGAMTPRKPVFNFQYDDGNAEDPALAELFTKYGFTCGFSLYQHAGLDTAFYLAAQERGFEILAHGTTAMGTSSTLTPTEVAALMDASVSYLRNLGYDIYGWVTPSSVLKADYQDVCNSRFEYATTGTLGAWTSDDVRTPNLTKYGDPRQISRISTDGSTIEGLTAAVNATIANGGFTTFYGHHFNNAAETNNTDGAKLEALLSLLKTKAVTGECLVLPPREAVNAYFAVRHFDFMEIYNLL